MVFTLNKKLRICARISNQPWDTIGCWYGNKYVISSEFKWLAHMVSTSMLLLNKVLSSFFFILGKKSIYLYVLLFVWFGIFYRLVLHWKRMPMITLWPVLEFYIVFITGLETLWDIYLLQICPKILEMKIRIVILESSYWNLWIHWSYNFWHRKINPL